jgi:threonine dehydratase
MAVSLEAGHRVEVEVSPTLADGLAGQVDDEGLAIGRFAIDAMRVVSEAEVAGAIAWMAREHDARVEGSGACGVAAVLRMKAGEWDGPIAVVVSGGNIDDAKWRGIVEQADPSHR